MNFKRQHTLKTPAKLSTRRLPPPQLSLLCPLPATTLTLYPKGNHYSDFKYHGFVLPTFTLYKWNHTVCAHLCLVSFTPPKSHQLFYGILLQEYITTYLAILLSIDFCVASSLQAIMNKAARYLFVYAFCT